MLVIVENRDIQSLFQALFDFEAAGCTDILQVDAAKSGSKPGNSFDDLFRVLSIQADGNSVDTAEFFK